MPYRPTLYDNPDAVAHEKSIRPHYAARNLIPTNNRTT